MTTLGAAMTTVTTGSDLYFARGSASHWGRFQQRAGRGKLRRDNVREAHLRARKVVEGPGNRRMRWFLDNVAERIIARVRDGALVEDELLAPGEMAGDFARAFRPFLRVGIHAGIQFERQWIDAAAPGTRQRQDAPSLPSINVEMSDVLAGRVDSHLQDRTRIAWVGISKTMREAVAKELAASIRDGDDLKTRIARIQAKASQMSKVQAARIARTESTASMGAGSQLEREDVGIAFKEWVSTYDRRTRTYADGEAFDHLAPDGQVVPNNGVFEIQGQRVRFPGDSSLGAAAGFLINCRCSSVSAWPDEPLDPTGAAPVTLPTPRPAPPVMPDIRHDGNTSDSFRVVVESAVRTMPEDVRIKLKDHGTVIRTDRLVTDILPELAGNHPRGWPTGATWDESDGLYDPSKNWVVATEFRRLRSGTTVPGRRAAGVMRHEAGHAYDDAVGISDSKEFRTAYDADMIDLHAMDAAVQVALRNKLSYYLQIGHAGRSEAVAEGIGVISGGGSGSWYEAEFRQVFPHSLDYLRRKVGL